MATNSGRSVKHARRSSRAPVHPHSVPVLAAEDPADAAVEQPFVEGAQDAIGPDLRHRMISEAAFHRYAERGYADGYDLDDWLQAEAEVDHVLVPPSAEERPH